MKITQQLERTIRQITRSQAEHLEFFDMRSFEQRTELLELDLILPHQPELSELLELRRSGERREQAIDVAM